MQSPVSESQRNLLKMRMSSGAYSQVRSDLTLGHDLRLCQGRLLSKIMQMYSR